MGRIPYTVVNGVKEKHWELREQLAESSDEEITKLVLEVLGWEIYEYPDSVPEQDQHGNNIESEVSLYGLKNGEGKIYTRGFAFKEDVYKSVNAVTYLFMGYIMKYLFDNDYTFEGHMLGNTVFVYIRKFHDRNKVVNLQIEECNDGIGLTRALCEALIIFLKEEVK